MKTGTVLLLAICTHVLIFASAAQAISDNLTSPQISEALEFGSANSSRIEPVLTELYGCCGKNRDLVIRSKWCKLALLTGIKAQQGRAPSGSEQSLILQDTNLQIDITAYGHDMDFARGYKAHILQEGKTLQPEMLHADHFQKGKNLPSSGHDFSGWYAIIRAYFPYTGLKLDRPFTLVLVKQRENRTYEINPRRFK